MKIAIGADHAGFEVKEYIKAFLIKEGYDVHDFGAHILDNEDGFPDYAIPVAKCVGNGEAERGVLVCGSGIGVSIAANKVKGVRAVNCTCEEFASISRLHNDTNIICLPGRFISNEDAKKFVSIWLKTEFLGGKYKKRNDMLESI